MIGCFGAQAGGGSGLGTRDPGLGLGAIRDLFDEK